jgi:molybdopterin molybdotransferase
MSMISVAEAKKIVLSQRVPLKVETINIDVCLGRKLAEDVLADRAMPPFDRVTMDGIAINFSDIEKGIRKWNVVKIQYAGESASAISVEGECVEIMTGAVLPRGCDTIIRYEDLELVAKESDEKQFKLIDVNVKQGQNIHTKGSDKAQGDIVLKANQTITATDLALLATVGQQSLLVYKKMSVAIIATGDELTGIATLPNDYQIRASNHIMISAALNELGIESVKYLMRDDLSELYDLLEKSLVQYDVIVLTGAVSKGKADFIPSILNKLKVHQLFHGVAQRPAKPFWFGRKEQCIVFAMPGNPVSAAVCSYVYLLPFFMSNMSLNLINYKVNVSEEIYFKPSLTYFMQAQVRQTEDGKLVAKPYPGNGSGDLTNLSEINAFVVLPQEDEKFTTNKLYDVYFTRSTIY